MYILLITRKAQMGTQAHTHTRARARAKSLIPHALDPAKKMQKQTTVRLLG